MWTPPEINKDWAPPEVAKGGESNWTPPELAAPDAPRPSVMHNFAQDLSDLKSGLSSLAASTMKTGYEGVKEGILHPGEYIKAIRSGGVIAPDSPLRKTPLQGMSRSLRTAAPQVVQGMKEDFTKLATHPMEALREHPLNQALNVLTLVDLLGGVGRLGIRTVGEGARLSGAETVATGARNILEGSPSTLAAGKATVPQVLSKNPIIQMAQQALIKTSDVVPGVKPALSMPGIRALVPPGAITDEARQALLAGKTMRQATLGSSAEYLKNVKSIGSKIGSLPEDERNAFTAVVEGRAVPFKMSPRFHDALDYYKQKVLSEAQRFNLPEETAKRTAYQPLVMASRAKYDEPLAVQVLKNDQAGIAFEASKGNQSAMKMIYASAARGDEAAQKIVSGWNKEVDATRIRQAETAAKEFLGTGSDAGTVARDIAKELTPQPIYFPHIFADKLKISDFIRLPTRLEKFRPSFLKMRTGAEGYIETDPAYALLVHEKQMQKFKSTEGLVNGVLDKFAEPLNKAVDLKPGYRVFTPEGAFKFYRTYLNFQDQFLKGLGVSHNIDDSFTEAAKNIMSSEVPENRYVVGVKRAPMYQIPKTVADKLGDELKTYNWPSTIHPVMKLIYDKPLDAFRYTVLGFRPGWVLHTTAGQVVTSALSRVNIAAGLKKLISPEMREALEPISGELEASTMRGAEKRFMGASRLRGGNPLERGAGTVGKVLFSNEPVMESQALEATRKILTFPLRAAKGFADSMFEANSRIEEQFRKAVAVEKLHGMAEMQATKETVSSFFPAKQALDRLLGTGAFTEEKIVARMKEIAKNPELRQEVLDSTFKVLNNYAGLNSFERGVVRKVVPFWSWWKFMNTFAIRTAFQDPVMADLARYASTFGADIRSDEWKQNGMDPSEVPIWASTGSIVGPTEDKKGVRVLQGRNPNPTSVLGASRLHVSPFINLFTMLTTGKDPTTNRYIDPNITEENGKLFYTDPATKKPKLIESASTPNIGTQAVRALVPPVSEIEQMAVPYRFEESSPLLGHHVPIPDSRGKKQPVALKDRIAGLLGMPVVDVERLALMKDKAAQIKAVREILRRRAMTKRAEQ